MCSPLDLLPDQRWGVVRRQPLCFERGNARDFRNVHKERHRTRNAAQKKESSEGGSQFKLMDR